MRVPALALAPLLLACTVTPAAPPGAGTTTREPTPDPAQELPPELTPEAAAAALAEVMAPPSGCPSVDGTWRITIGLDGGKQANLELAGTVCDFTWTGEGASGSGGGTPDALTLDIPLEKNRATCTGATDRDILSMLFDCTAPSGDGGETKYTVVLARGGGAASGPPPETSITTTPGDVTLVLRGRVTSTTATAGAPRVGTKTEVRIFYDGTRQSDSQEFGLYHVQGPTYGLSVELGDFKIVPDETTVLRVRRAPPGVSQDWPKGFWTFESFPSTTWSYKVFWWGDGANNESQELFQECPPGATDAQVALYTSAWIVWVTLASCDVER